MRDTDNQVAAAELRDGNILLAVFGVGFLSAGLLLTPDHLIALGPMRTSLQSHNAFVRHIAELEVDALRGVLAATGIGLVLLALFSRQLRQLQWLRGAFEYPVRTQSSHLSRLSCAIMCAAAAVCLALIALGPDLPEGFADMLVREDGLIEYGTAILFLAASVLSLNISGRVTDRRRRIAHLVLAFFFFACFGEEVSWGQRKLGFGTPEALSRINAQDEFNLHNSLGYLVDHLFIAGAFIYCVVLPVFVSRSPVINYVAVSTGLPIASLGLAAGFAVASLMHDWTVYLVIADHGWRVAEFREFLTALGFVLLMLEQRHPEQEIRPAFPGRLSEPS